MKKLAEFGIDTVNKRVAPARYWDQRGMAMRGPYVPASPAAENPLLPEVTARIAVEQASTFGWERYVGRRSGRIIGMKTFGASAPLKELLRKFRFEPERVTEVAKELLGKGDS